MGMDSVPDHMLACQVVEYEKDYKIHEIETPKKDLEPQDLLVKLAVSSLCHTDGMVVNGDFSTELPCTASHEGAGTVVAVGSDVKGFKEGDRVMCGIPYHACGECEDCKSVDTQYCTRVKHTGVTRNGCFANYAVVDSITSAPLPDNVSFETAAPLACAGCTIYKGVLTSECGEGDWLAIVGSGGGLGHLGIQFARARGVRVIGIDARDEGLELSREVGADAVVDARGGDDEVVRQVKEIVKGGGVKAALVVSDAKSAATTACRVTRMHGTVVQIAQPPTVDIPFVELVFRDIRIKGSLICNPQEAREMLETVGKHGISVKTNAVQGIEKVPELVRLAHGGKMQGKGIVIIDQAQIDKQNSQGIKMF